MKDNMDGTKYRETQEKNFKSPAKGSFISQQVSDPLGNKKA